MTGPGRAVGNKCTGNRVGQETTEERNRKWETERTSCHPVRIYEIYGADPQTVDERTDKKTAIYGRRRNGAQVREGDMSRET